MMTRNLFRVPVVVLIRTTGFSVMFGLVSGLVAGPNVGPHALAGDCHCESACHDCGPQGADCRPDCPPFRKPNLIYKSLDAVAGGIERVLGLHKIHCGSGCDGGCDSGGCGGGCDSAGLQEWSPHYETEYHPPRPSGASSHHRQASPAEGYHSPNQFQPGPVPMRMGEPTFVDPQPIESHPMPYQNTPPESFDPPVHPQEGLSNPFMDDARVMTKRRIQRTHYQRSASSSNDPESGRSELQ